MRRLGYTRYVAQGGDQGAAVTDAMGRQAPEGLRGIHMNLLVTALGGGAMPAETEQERAALEQTKTFRASGFGYFLEQATRPQTIGYALLDSPVALAAWMLDHDTDAYYKISRAFVDGQPSGGLTRDHILDNITVYWLTGTGASAARSYWESGRAQALAAGQAPPEVKLPVSFTTFPGEIFRAPRSWVEQGYPRPHLLPRGRQGRPLRRMGRARAVRNRDPGGVQAAALTTTCTWRSRGVGSPAAMANELGLRNVAFEAIDLQAAVDWAATEGYGLVGGIGEYEGAWRMAYVRGPEGIIVSLAERIG